MKLIYQVIMDMYKEMEELIGKEGKAHYINYAKEFVSSNTFHLSYIFIIKILHKHVTKHNVMYR